MNIKGSANYCPVIIINHEKGEASWYVHDILANYNDLEGYKIINTLRQ